MTWTGPGSTTLQAIRIGAGFSFDAARRQVCDEDGTPLHLTPKAFDLLQILIDATPRVVPKSELHARLWPETFVTDAALTVLVKEIRRVLCDRDREPPLIKTVHGIGYAFESPRPDATRATVTTDRAGVHWLVTSFRRFALDPGENVIGRDPAATIWLDEVDVSRRHARIVVSGDRAVIEDLESKNGTAIGHRRLTAPRELTDGDEIRVGNVSLTYRRIGVDQSTATGLGV